MSDTAIAASTESASSSSSSTPVDTASIAASVISDVESGNQEGSSSSSSSASRASSAPQTKTEAEPDDFDAEPAERVDVLGRKRENAIPHSRVTKMIAKKERAVISAVAKELGISKAEAELKLEDVMGALTERKTKFSDYESRIKQVEVLDQIAATDGDRFVRMLAEANPQVYGKFLKVLEATGDANVAAAAATGATPSAQDDPMPAADYPVRDESGKVIGMTYSAEGLQKLRAWDRREAVREAEAKINKRLEPFEKEREDRQKAERLRDLDRQATAAVNTQLERAAKWPGFKENEGDILKALQADKTISLHDAYIQVVMPKMHADRNKMREELIAETNSKPKSTSTPTAVGAQKASDKPRSTADIAREVMAELG